MISYALAYLVIILCIVNLARMACLMIGSDLYVLQQAAMKKRQGMQKLKLPTFSVVIPAYNEEHTVVRAVESVLNANYPKELLEIIVADDGSTDATAHRVKALLTDARCQNIRLVTQPNAGKARALNNALKKYAKGELVMCLDADSCILPEALLNATRYFVDQRVVALSANVKIIPTGTFLNLIQQFEYLVCYQMKRAQTYFNIEYIIGGIGSTFRRSALEKVGFYDTDTITEDIDLTFKLIKESNKDARLVYGSDVVAYTESVPNISGLIRQRFRWKHGRSQTFLKNTELFFGRDTRHTKGLTWIHLPYALFSDLAFFLEPLVLGYIFYIIFTYHDWTTLLSAIAVVSTYLALNALAEHTFSIKERVKFVLLAPLMYFCMYVLSFVEYVALIKSYSKVGELVRSVGKEAGSWNHVGRASVAAASNNFPPLWARAALVFCFASASGSLWYSYHEMTELLTVQAEIEQGYNERNERLAYATLRQDANRVTPQFYETAMIGEFGDFGRGVSVQD